MTTEPETPVQLHLKANAKLMKSIFKLHSKFNTDERIVFNGTSIDSKIVDPAHVAMIVQKIPVDILEEYNNNKETVPLGIDVEKILSVFTGRLKQNDTITLDYNPVKEQIISTFNLFTQNTATITTDNMPDPKIPNLDLPATAVLDTKLIYEFIKQANKITDHIAIFARNDGLYFFAKGDTDTARLFIPRDQIPHYYYHSAASLFSVDYLYMILQELKTLHDQITLHLGNDNPLQLTAETPVETQVLLAPRIESDSLATAETFNDYMDPGELNTPGTPETPPEEPEETTPDQPEEENNNIAVTPEEIDQGYTQEDADLILNKEEEPSEPQQPTEYPTIKHTGPTETINGQKVQFYTDEELLEAARLRDKYEKKHREHILKRLLHRLKDQKQDKQTRNPELQTNIDINTILDTLEDYDYTWNHEKIGDC